MGSISSLIEVFRMSEISPEVRERIIRKLGFAINDEMAMNATEELVVELVLALNPKSKIAEEEHYARYVKASAGIGGDKNG